MNHLSVEIKAKYIDHAKVRSVLRVLKAGFNGTDYQKDTYFKVSRGRLKLREGKIENYLIFYDRENKEGPKQSEVILFDYDLNSSLKEILLKSLDVLVIVEKRREIFFSENVKIHLDNVKNLGMFVEIEAIDTDGSFGKEKLLEQCESYLQILNIPKDDLIAVSYSDLLLQKIKTPGL